MPDTIQAFGSEHGPALLALGLTCVGVLWLFWAIPRWVAAEDRRAQVKRKRKDDWHAAMREANRALAATVPANDRWRIVRDEVRLNCFYLYERRPSVTSIRYDWPWDKTAPAPHVPELIWKQVSDHTTLSGAELAIRATLDAEESARRCPGPFRFINDTLVSESTL